jgi:hypothetical protein
MKRSNFQERPSGVLVVRVERAASRSLVHLSENSDVLGAKEGDVAQAFGYCVRGNPRDCASPVRLSALVRCSSSDRGSVVGGEFKEGETMQGAADRTLSVLLLTARPCKENLSRPWLL